MSNTVALQAFAPAADVASPAPGVRAAAAIRRFLRGAGRRFAALTEGASVHGAIEGAVTVATLGFVGLVVAAFW